MSENNSDAGKVESKTSRRTLFKAGAAAIVAPIGAGVVVGSSSEDKSNSERADRIHDRARHIREKTGSQEKFKNYLRNHADHFDSKKYSFTKGSKSDGPSTQEWSESKVDGELVLTHYSCPFQDTVAYIDYQITVDGTYGGGEGGPDQIALFWHGSDYRYQQDSAYIDGNMDNVNLIEESLYGVDWEWKDGKSCHWPCGTKQWSVGCKADILGSDNQRAVQGSYYDMSFSATVESVTFSSDGGVSFEFSKEGDQDQYAVKIATEDDVVNDACM